MLGTKKQKIIKFTLASLLLFTAIVFLYQSAHQRSVDLSKSLLKQTSQTVELNQQLEKTTQQLKTTEQNYIEALKEVETTKKEKEELSTKLEQTTAQAKTQAQSQEQNQPQTQTTTSAAKAAPAAAKKETAATETTGKRYVGTFKTTYYCGENYPHICGTGNGITASGAKATAGTTVAADTNVLPMGTHIYIEGIGERIVQDRGGGIKGNKLDVFVNTHSDALSRGVQNRKVWIME